MFSFWHFWFATVQEVLQADWQEAWHSPQPPLAQLSFRFALFKVLTWLIVVSSFLPRFYSTEMASTSILMPLYHSCKGISIPLLDSRPDIDSQYTADRPGKQENNCFDETSKPE